MKNLNIFGFEYVVRFVILNMRIDFCYLYEINFKFCVL